MFYYSTEMFESMKNAEGSEQDQWDLHVYTVSLYDSPYKGEDADELLCQSTKCTDFLIRSPGSMILALSEKLYGQQQRYSAADSYNKRNNSMYFIYISAA